MSQRGHVFVVRGDAAGIACDWRLVPSGTTPGGVAGEIGEHWLHDEAVRRKVAAPGWPDEAPNSDRRAVVVSSPDPAPEGAPGVVAVHTGERGDEPPEWFARALTAAVEILAVDAPRHLPDRALPLLVTPMLGTGAGGAGDRRTTALEELLAAADRVASNGWDVALVVRNAQTFSAAQRVRADGATWALTDQESVLVDELAELARRNKLVPFVGAGASAAAGLPGWSKLLEDLGDEVGITDSAEVDQLTRMDPRDAARVLDLRFRAPRTLDTALREIFDPARRASLVHAELASLPITEAATTNYDRLFETAWSEATGESVSVLPRDDTRPARRWLLKLHGDIDDRRRDLVLSREAYLRFERRGGAVAGVLQAMLLTRHLLIVGYGLTDETFHRIAHDVREIRTEPLQRSVAVADRQRRLGTALLVTPPDLSKDVWQEDLRLVDLTAGTADRATAARRQEILLDRLAHLAAPVEAYVLGSGWEELTPEGPDLELRRVLGELGSIDGLHEPLKRAVDAVLHRFGRDTSDRARG